MAIRFNEIRQYLARNAKLSICFEDGHYHDYLMISDIPNEKYNDLDVYGIGMVDVEFSMDLYTHANELEEKGWPTKDDTLAPAVEIVLHERPRDIERSAVNVLLFMDLKPYLQIGRNFSIVDREDWTSELYEYRRDIPPKYDEMFVYGIGMEDVTEEADSNIIKALKDNRYDSCIYKRMVIVLSNAARIGAYRAS